MSVPRTLEERLTAPLEDALSGLADHDARLDVLEAAAAELGCFGLAGYRRLGDGHHALPVRQAQHLAGPLLKRLRHVPMPPALALSALARPPLTTAERRTAGVYYTDFRLARHLAATLPADLDAPLIDPACGSGGLLAAAALHVAGDHRRRRTDFLAEHVCGADLSAPALRGAVLALASLTDDLDAIQALRGRLRLMDSLDAGPAAWADVAPEGFAAVIGNPPWEKLKLSRHEHLRFAGAARHYGDDYADEAADGSRAFGIARSRMARYLERVGAALELQGTGEADLYKLFMELGLNLVRDGGHVALIVPAGLIRSHGTAALRRHLLEEARSLEIGVLHNHARFFAIDTRFKFLTVTARVRGGGPRAPLRLVHLEGTSDGVRAAAAATLGRHELFRCRPDGSVPEVRGTAEWRLFARMHEHGPRFGDPHAQWRPDLMREVDMTTDRPRFTRAPGPGTLPVVEGRMVHQYRAGAKRHVGGTGRRAVWVPLAPGAHPMGAQFHVPWSALRPAVLERIERPRVGFCDITGQTNERGMLAALIPAEVVCGNKVPTIVFGGPGADDRRRDDLAHLWLAVANSLPFDWLLRRVLTTTVNFFLLRDLPMPDLPVESLPARRLIELARRLTRRDQGTQRLSAWEAGQLRAQIDALAAVAYGLDEADLNLILGDFRLLDRGQPPLPGEDRSTVTRDVFLAAWHARAGHVPDGLAARVSAAQDIGAAPYVPAGFPTGQADAVDEQLR